MKNTHRDLTMHPYFERMLKNFQKFCCKILKSGPMPKHVAFIMDGNRRYAHQNALGSVLEGHTQGYSALSATLEWCKELNITEVTIYAFSIENFKRTKAEVDGLFDMARQKLTQMKGEKSNISKNDLRFRFWGNLNLLPVDIQDSIRELVASTANNSSFALNICFAYTSTDETGRAVGQISSKIQNGEMSIDDLDMRSFSETLDSSHSPDPDLLIRTSGENRLSDFLLYQSSYTCLYFDDILWPDYNLWHLSRAILYYQMHYSDIERIKTSLKEIEEATNGLTNNPPIML